jgi:ribosome biogenesis GTP-binding protein YsxC/EngB
MMVKPTYSLVRESPATDYFFEINDMYLEIVFVGRANAGKSSLINALTDQPVLAKTSSRPNSTRTVTFYQSASPAEMAKFANRNPSRLVKLPGGGLQFTFVDVPGFGIEGMTDKWRDNAISLTDSYLGVRRSVNTVFMCIDVRLGVTPTDLTYFEWLENLHGVFWVILTKCDAVSHARICKVMSDVYKLITSKANKRKYRRLYPFVLPVSAHAGTNIDTLRALIVETSGVLPGDALRKLLQRRRDELWAKLRDVDSERLACKAREEAAGREELYRRLLSGSPSDTYQHTSDIAEQPAAGRVPDGAADADFIVEPVEVTPPIEISGRASTQRSNRLSIPGAEASGFSFNTGMGPAPDVVPRDDTLEAVVGASLRPPPGLSASAPVAASEKPASAAPRKGLVSTYMDDADGFMRRGSRRDGQTTGRNGARAGGAARQQPGVYIAQSDGSLRRASGAVAPTAARTVAPQSARERLSQLQRISPSAPWSQPLRRMTPAEREAYAKRSGGTSVVGAAAVQHVEEQMWRGETRAVSTLRKERELQHHANGRASRTMLPVGLWNQYGGAGKSSPGSVMGL